MKHYTCEEVAEMMQLHPVTVQRKARAGLIPGATNAGGPWRIPEEGFHEWLESGYAGREPAGVADPKPRGKVQRTSLPWGELRAISGGTK